MDGGLMPEFNKRLFDLMEENDALSARSRDEIVRAPFGWPGGKYRSIKQLNQFIPVRHGFCEVCGGSGVVTLNRPESKLEIFNDRYAGVVAFYRCIRDSAKCEKLVERLTYTLHSREEWKWCRDNWENCWDDVERAARWYYTIRMSFTQLGRNWGRSTNGIPQQAKALHNSLALFSRFHDRFKNVQIENLDAIQCIHDYDSPDMVFYVDPDYQDTDPGIYKHRVEHELLLRTIFDSKGFFAVSGYANPLYDSYNWDDRQTWEVVVTAKSQGFTGNLAGMENAMIPRAKAEEVLWIKESK